MLEQPAANLSVHVKIRGIRKLGFPENDVRPVESEGAGRTEYVTRQKFHKRLRVEYKFEAQRETDSFLVWQFANDLWNRLSTETYLEQLKAVGMAVVRKEPMVDYELVSAGRKLSVALFEVLYSFRDVLESPTEIVENLKMTVSVDEREKPLLALPGFPAEE